MADSIRYWLWRWFGIERRKEKRYQNIRGLEILFSSRSIRPVSKEGCEDLSVHGIRFYPGVELYKGEKIEMKLRFAREFQGPEEIYVLGEVLDHVTSSTHSLGAARCKLYHADQTSKQALKSYLEWHDSLTPPSEVVSKN